MNTSLSRKPVGSNFVSMQGAFELCAQLSLVVYDNMNSYMNPKKDLKVKLLAIEDTKEWRVTLFQYENGELIVVGRGSDNMKNWRSNLSAHTFQVQEKQIKDEITKTIRAWEDKFGKIDARTGHSAIVRYLVDQENLGIYFNGDGLIESPNNFNLRTSADPVTLIPGNFGKSVTIGKGGHGMKKCLAAIQKANFTVEDYYKAKLEENQTWYDSSLKGIFRLTPEDRIIFASLIEGEKGNDILRHTGLSSYHTKKQSPKKYSKELYFHAYHDAAPFLQLIKEKSHPQLNINEKHSTIFHNQQLLALSLNLNAQGLESDAINKALDKASKKLMGASIAYELNVPFGVQVGFMEEAFDKAKELGASITEELSKAGKNVLDVVTLNLVAETANVAAQYLKLASHERQLSSEQKELMRSFKFKQKLLGFREDLSDFSGMTEQRILRTLLRSDPLPSLLLNVHQINESIQIYENRIKTTRKYLEQRELFSQDLSIGRDQLHKIEEEIQREINKSSHGWSRLQKYLILGVEAATLVAAVTAVSPLAASMPLLLPTLGVTTATGHGALTIISDKRSKLRQDFSQVLDHLLQAEQTLLSVSERNVQITHHLRGRLQELEDFCIYSPQVFDPAIRLARLQESKNETQAQIDKVNRDLNANKSAYDKAEGSRKYLEQNYLYSPSIQKKSKRRRRVQAQIAIHINEKTVCSAEALSLQRDLDDKNERLQDVNRKIEEELACSQYTAHFWKWLEKRQPRLDTATMQLRARLTEITRIASSQLKSDYAPWLSTLNEFYKLAQQLESQVGLKTVKGFEFLSGAVKVCKELESLYFYWNGFLEERKNHESYLKTLQAMGTVTTLASLMVPAVAAVSGGIALWHLGKQILASKEERKDPLQELGCLFLNAIQAAANFQTEQLNALEEELKSTLSKEFIQERKKLQEISGQIFHARLEISQLGGEITAEIKKLEVKQEKRSDQQDIIRYKEKIESQLREIKKISVMPQTEYLKNLRLYLELICTPDLNALTEGEKFSQVPSKAVAVSPHYYTGLLAAKIGFPNQPNLYLFNGAVEGFIKFLKSTGKKDRTTILKIYQEMQHLSSMINHLLGKVEVFMDRTIEAKQILNGVVQRKLRYMAECQEYSSGLNREGHLTFDFHSELLGKKSVGAQKFIFSDIFHENPPQLKLSSCLEEIKERLSDELRGELYTSPKKFVLSGAIRVLEKVTGSNMIEGGDLLLKSRIKRLNSAKIIHLQIMMPRLISGELAWMNRVSDGATIHGSLKSDWKSDADIHMNWPIKSSVNFSESVDKIQFVVHVFFANRTKQSKVNLRMTNTMPGTFWTTDHSFDTELISEPSTNTKSIIDLTFTINLTGAQEYSITAAANSLFQTDDYDWKKIPLSSGDAKKYQIRLKKLILDYKGYLNSQMFLCEPKEDNLFIKKMRNHDEECILSNTNNHLIPLIFPKNFIEHWKRQLRIDHPALNLKGTGIFVPFYDLRNAQETNTFQLVVEFRYFETNSAQPPKVLAQVIVADFDKETVHCFRKINFVDDDYEIDEIPNVNEFLFQVMYADLFEEGGLPDKNSHVLKNGKFIAPHESRFIGLHQLLENQPGYCLSFNSKKYDHQVNDKLKDFLITGDISLVSDFIIPATPIPGLDFNVLDSMIRKTCNDPLMEKSQEFKKYEESYHLLYALTRLVSGEDKITLKGSMDEYLGLEKPHNNRLPKISKTLRSPAKEAFIGITQLSASAPVKKLHKQMTKLKKLMDEVNKSDLCEKAVKKPSSRPSKGRTTLQVQQPNPSVDNLAKKIN